MLLIGHLMTSTRFLSLLQNTSLNRVRVQALLIAWVDNLTLMKRLDNACLVATLIWFLR